MGEDLAGNDPVSTFEFYRLGLMRVVLFLSEVSVHLSLSFLYFAPLFGIFFFGGLK